MMFKKQLISVVKELQDEITEISKKFNDEQQCQNIKSTLHAEWLDTMQGQLDGMSERIKKLEKKCDFIYKTLLNKGMEK